MARFIGGLQPEVKFHLVAYNPNTYDQAVEIATNYDNAARQRASEVTPHADSVINTMQHNETTNPKLKGIIQDALQEFTQAQRYTTRIPERDNWRRQKYANPPRRYNKRRYSNYRQPNKRSR